MLDILKTYERNTIHHYLVTVFPNHLSHHTYSCIAYTATLHCAKGLNRWPLPACGLQMGHKWVKGQSVQDQINLVQFDDTVPATI